MPGARRSEPKLKLPLKTSYRYVHEPLTTREEAVPLLGNGQLIEELVQRLRHSRGGTFLITGFRGVGKSTVIARALESIGSAGDEVVVPITINVARPMTPDQLLFAIVRRLYETLQDRRVLKRLDDRTRRALMLAHIRTSLGLKQTRSDASEKSAALNIGMGPVAAKLTGPAGWLAPSTGLTAKRTRSLAMEASYLTYSDSDAEHDIGRIIDLLSRPERRKWWRRRGPRVHLIVVLDEVDKLTSEPSGLEEVEKLLGHLKNTLTMRGAHFLLAAGPDLHDHAVTDASRGNSVYESIFAWQRYVPCSWDAPDLLVRGVLADEAPPSEVGEVIRYLRFKARGIPRRLLQEFGEFVHWDDDRPFLVVGEHDRKRIAFYAEVEELLDAYFGQGRSDRLFQVEIDDDRWRMAGYFVMDWILRRQGDAFTAADIAGPKEKPELDPLLRPAEPDVERLLRHLTAQGFLTVVHDPRLPDVTVIVDEEPDGGPVAYKLASSVRERLLDIAWANANERAALDVSLRLSMARGRDTTTGPGSVLARGLESVLRVIADRYELVEVIAYGGMSTVYRARDVVARREVAVKIPRPEDGTDMLLRFRREVDIVTKLRHPRIVRTLEATADEDGTPLIVMELVPGMTLKEMVVESGPLSPTAVVRLGEQVTEALEYLEVQGVSRIDLKPDNIMMTPERGAILIDFGIAKRTDLLEVTLADSSVGTPAYMAPESFEHGKADIRTDLYALGVVLYFALTGDTPYGNAASVNQIVNAILRGHVDAAPLAHVPDLRDVIMMALASDPDDRFQHPADMRAALRTLQLQEL
ncbi:protein kinase [Nonomuraea sp. NPDC049421]|uniref:protein kinase domain-containing protein n=1 Tax=Nonomuraea sp. NPDC049421 TaxID=3155275 RepID=UPI003443CAD2